MSGRQNIDIFNAFVCMFLVQLLVPKCDAHELTAKNKILTINHIHNDVSKCHKSTSKFYMYVNIPAKVTRTRSCK